MSVTASAGGEQVSGGVGRSIAHDSAPLHVSGRAHYTDDIPEPRGTLHAALGLSDQPHAEIASLDLSAVRAAPGVVDVITASDLPGSNNFGALLEDDPLLADGTVQFAGQALFAVVATKVNQARRAVLLAQVEYRPLPALLEAAAALEAESFVLPTQTMSRGDAPASIAAAPHQLRGQVRVGGQEQFYLEGHIALALPRDNGDMHVYSSTQHPGEVQHAIAHVLGKSAMDVTVECRRMGGAFGGKESQPAQFACIAAVLAQRSGRAVKLRLDRDVDMAVSGKRHDFVIDYHVGFDNKGEIKGLEFVLTSRCGMSADLSGAINDRAMFHCDNAYYLANVHVISHRCKTHTVSNTAFRGFGGPQGMFAIEHVIDEIARSLDSDPLDVRRVNLYGTSTRNVTHYGQQVDDNILDVLLDELEDTSSYRARRQDIARFNAASPIIRRGIALTPVKFGISFTATHLNQAGALVNIYSDGSVHLNHGGTEMGQGLNTKVTQVVAQELQVDFERIKVTAADTSKVPNASATAASSGADLNGMAAQAAARKLRERLQAVAAEHFGVSEGEVRFAPNRVQAGNHSMSFAELVHVAYMARVSLSATGFYRTPKIHYDRETLSGRPFYYFAYGAAVSEVEIDTLTGEHRVLRIDILHDCGRSLNPAIDLGQVEGGFVQGMGWLTTEELCWNPSGQLATHSPSTYKIPVAGDVPAAFNVRLLESGENREETVHRSKAVGEPPLMLALSVFHAIRDAVASVGDGDSLVRIDAPATPEAVLNAVDRLRAKRQG